MTVRWYPLSLCIPTRPHVTGDTQMGIAWDSRITSPASMSVRCWQRSQLGKAAGENVAEGPPRPLTVVREHHFPGECNTALKPIRSRRPTFGKIDVLDRLVRYDKHSLALKWDTRQIRFQPFETVMAKRAAV
jgi:hypothetical protein